MKKFVSILLALTLALSLFVLAGCASKSADTTQPSTETPAQSDAAAETPAADTEETPAADDTAADADKTITVGASSTSFFVSIPSGNWNHAVLLRHPNVHIVSIRISS